MTMKTGVHKIQKQQRRNLGKRNPSYYDVIIQISILLVHLETAFTKLTNMLFCRTPANEYILLFLSCMDAIFKQ